MADRQLKCSFYEILETKFPAYWCQQMQIWTPHSWWCHPDKLLITHTNHKMLVFTPSLSVSLSHSSTSSTPSLPITLVLLHALTASYKIRFEWSYIMTDVVSPSWWSLHYRPCQLYGISPWHFPQRTCLFCPFSLIFPLKTSNADLLLWMKQRPSVKPAVNLIH